MTFTITALRTDLLFQPDGSDELVRCDVGVEAVVSERQAVHALGRTDIEVGLPDGYAEQLIALNPSAADVADPSKMTVAQLDAAAVSLGVRGWGGNKADKVQALTDALSG